MFAAKSVAPLAAMGAVCRPVLDEAAEAHITLFTTPPGYLLSESLKAALDDRGHPTLWLRIGSEDQDPATFMLSLIAAAQRLRPEFGINLQILMQQTPGPIAGWPALYRHLARELVDGLPRGSAIVLEQIHNLNNAQPVIGLLGTQLLPGLPEKLPCILIAQDRFPTGILPNNTIIRGVKDLRINARSGLDLAKKNEADLSGDCIRRAISLIEGRAVALAGLFTACRSLGPAFIQRAVSLSKNANHLYTLIARASLGSAAPGDLSALSLVMHLDYFHPSMAQAVFGSSIMPQGPWMQPLADQWRRMRRVWLSPLRAALRLDMEANYTSLQRAADYLLKQGAVEQAVRLYLGLKDTSTAAWAIARVAEQMMNLGQWDTLGRWLDQLPSESLHEWPWLIYIQGEIAAADGRTESARRSFSTATSLFSKRHENDGACQSLLAESALAAWQNDRDRAQSYALAASALAEAGGLEWQQTWATWQLGCMSAANEELDSALAYFTKAAQTASDPLIAGRFRQVENLAISQRDFRRQREFHHQAYLQAEQAEKATAGQLNSILSSPPENLAALLSTYGWSGIPLPVKSSGPGAAEKLYEPPEGSKIWQNVLKVLGFYNRSSGLSDKTGEAELPSLPETMAIPTPPGARSMTSSHSATMNIKDDAIDFLVEDIGSSYEGRTFPAAPTIIPSASKEEAGYSINDPLNSVLTVHMLGAFRIYVDEHPIEKWPGSRGQAVLKYLLSHREQETSRDVLMEVFWPEAKPESARNNLNVALHNLRQAFRKVTQTPVIEYDKGRGSYRVNPELQVWIDVDEFNHHLQAARKLESVGQLSHALGEYEIAASLYQGDFLSDDLYEEWPILTRERLRIAYLDLLDHLSHIYFSQGQYTACVTLCQLILERDNCREDAHRRLMRCYSRQGQQHLALRQFQNCVETLRSELDVDPEQATKQLCERIRRHESI